MSIGDENVAVRRGHHGGRRVEFIRTAAGDTGLAEPQQNLAFGAELEHLVALAVFAQAIGHPHVALAIHVDAVREDQQSLAETLH